MDAVQILIMEDRQYQRKDLSNFQSTYHNESHIMIETDTEMFMVAFILFDYDRLSCRIDSGTCVSEEDPELLICLHPSSAEMKTYMLHHAF